jgi:formiminotetrahydrofolate cyclodeaminase
MSKSGQLIRGLKWSLQKKGDGTYPKGIEENEDRNSELKNYLDFVKDKDEGAVKKVLINLRHLQRQEKRNTVKINELKNFLFSEKMNPEKPISKKEKGDK